jgi:hypothetical protein
MPDEKAMVPITADPRDHILALYHMVYSLCARVNELEQEIALSPSGGTYVDVSEEIHADRYNLWVLLWRMDPEYSHMTHPEALYAFAVDHRHHFHEREFRRWFQLRQTHAPGSARDLLIRRLINERLEKARQAAVSATAGMIRLEQLR